MSRVTHENGRLRGWVLGLVLLVALGCGLASAQVASGSDPEQVADQAVRSWLEQDRQDLGALGSLSAEELCSLAPQLLQSPPPPEGTSVAFGSRQEVASEDEAVRLYSYAASLPGERLEVVDVRLEREGAGWNAVRVGFDLETAPRGVRLWLQEPLAG